MGRSLGSTGILRLFLSFAFAVAFAAACTTSRSGAGGVDGPIAPTIDAPTTGHPDAAPGHKPDAAVHPPDAHTGSACIDDLHCPAGDYCVQATGTCAALVAGTCSGTHTTGCMGRVPQCRDSSCFNPGTCSTSADCHAGETCVAKGGSTLCEPTSPCSLTVSTTDVANGVYAEGKEVCLHAKINEVIAESDGDFHVRLGTQTTLTCGNGANPAPTKCVSATCPFEVTPPGKGLVTELTPEYQAAGIATPVAGDTIDVQGTVRWDGAHCWWEVHPIKYWKKM